MERDQSSPTRFEALKMVVDAYGGQKATAEAFGTNQPFIWRLIHQAKQIPAEWVLKAEADTGISRHYLRPDIYPRGLVDAEPFNPEEPLLDIFCPIALAARQTAGDQDARFRGVDQRAGAQV